MFNLTGKKALVTGASGGLGSAIAKRLHKAGAHVVITGTREEKLQELKKELGSNVTVVVANLSSGAEVISMYEKMEAEVGGIDILVCNAGITRDNLLIRMSEEEFDQVIAVNLKAVWLLNRAAMQSMGKRKYGRIINISSVVGVTGNFGQTNYAAAKSGLIGMSKSAALEGASRGVTVNCVAPGFIATPMTDVIKEEIKDKVKAKIPMGAFGNPEDIAAAVHYLSSEEAGYMTGAVLNVNGGLAM